MKKDILKEKSFDFAVRIVKLAQYLQNDKKEFVLSKQILRSGTAIGALVAEARYGQSDADFLFKMTIALKEANEVMYWLNLLEATYYITQLEHESIYKDCNEILSLLIATTKTVKNKIELQEGSRARKEIA